MPMHQRHIEQIHYSLHQEMNELYWSAAIKNFAIGLVGIFNVMYVFLYFNHSVPLTMTFYLVQFVGQVLLVPLAARWLKIGLKKMMAIGVPFLGIYLILLLLAKELGTVAIVLAVMAKIIYLVLFWPSRHVDFAKFSQKLKRGRQIGVRRIIVAIVKTMAPILGGFIIVKFGFTPAYIIAAILFVVSAVPLFFSSEVYEKFSWSYGKSFKKLFEKKNRKISLAFLFEGIEYAVGIFIFPIFIYLVIKNFETIGLITSLSLLLTIIFTYLIGWATDKKGSHKVINFSSIVHGFAWVITAFISTPLQYFIYSSFLRLSETANHLPFTALLYRKAKGLGHGIDEYIVFHEIAHNTGRIILALLVIIGFSLGLDNFLIYFTIAGVAAFLFRLFK